MERTIQHGKIEVNSWGGSFSNLRCPRCGEDFLHQGTVTIFDRSEDEDLTTVTTVSNGLSATHLRPSIKVDNPSERRQGMTIAFECEGCGAQAAENGRAAPMIELTIAQHKGVTLIRWKYDVFG